GGAPGAGGGGTGGTAEPRRRHHSRRVRAPTHPQDVPPGAPRGPAPNGGGEPDDRGRAADRPGGRSRLRRPAPGGPRDPGGTLPRQRADRRRPPRPPARRRG